MRLAITLFLCLLGSPAFAAGCDRWTASMEEDEGGPRMTAAICTGTGDDVHHFLVQCGADGELGMRYIPAPSTNYPPGDTTNFRAEFEFSLDQEMFTRQAQYEEMDGAMAMSTKIGDAFLEVMMIQKAFVLGDVDGKLPGVTFTLKGSREALDKVIRSCGK